MFDYFCISLSKRQRTDHDGMCLLVATTNMYIHTYIHTNYRCMLYQVVEKLFNNFHILLGLIFIFYFSIPIFSTMAYEITKNAKCA